MYYNAAWIFFFFLLLFLENHSHPLDSDPAVAFQKASTRVTFLSALGNVILRQWEYMLQDFKITSIAVDCSVYTSSMSGTEEEGTSRRASLGVGCVGIAHSL